MTTLANTTEITLTAAADVSAPNAARPASYFRKEETSWRRF